MSQAEAILNYLKSGRSITPLEALEKFGTMRLGARIWDLERQGYEIDSQLIELPNKKHCASYRLVTNPTAERIPTRRSGVSCERMAGDSRTTLKAPTTQGTLFDSTNYTDY